MRPEGQMFAITGWWDKRQVPQPVINLSPCDDVRSFVGIVFFLWPFLHASEFQAMSMGQQREIMWHYTDGEPLTQQLGLKESVNSKSLKCWQKPGPDCVQLSRKAS